VLGDLSKAWVEACGAAKGIPRARERRVKLPVRLASNGGLLNDNDSHWACRPRATPGDLDRWVAGGGLPGALGPMELSTVLHDDAALGLATITN